MTETFRNPPPAGRFSDSDEVRSEQLSEALETGAWFVEAFKQRFPGADVNGRVLDLGCRSALTSIDFARAFPTCRIDGVDGLGSLLGRGRRRIAEADLQGRITLIEVDLREARLSRERYQVIVSQHSLHRLQDAGAFWQTVRRHGAPGTMVMATDLRRPETGAQAEQIVRRVAPEADPRTKAMLMERLDAAYTIEEVRALLLEHGCAELHVASEDDARLVVWGALGGGQ